MQRGSATVGVNVLADQGVLMIFSPIMPDPGHGARGLLPPAARALVRHHVGRRVRHQRAAGRGRGARLRRLSALDYEEFEDILATVGEVADKWDDSLIQEFGT